MLMKKFRGISASNRATGAYIHKYKYIHEVVNTTKEGSNNDKTYYIMYSTLQERFIPPDWMEQIA